MTRSSKASSPCQATAVSTSRRYSVDCTMPPTAGWLVVEAEQDPRKAHPLTYASLGHRNLIAMALTAGFEVSTVP